MTDDITPPIKTMQLYSHMDRIWNELAELGIDRSSEDTIPIEVMNKFDCLNYGGTVGAAQSAKALCIDESSWVLDVGSGLGGPARCVSAVSGAKIVGVELQSDLAVLANELSRRCGVADSVTVTWGNILDESLQLGESGAFDAAMSWLVILHVPLAYRGRLFQRLHDMLKPGARVYIEDFYRKSIGNFSESDKELLCNEVYVPDSDLPSRKQYIDTVSAAGFIVDFQDVSGEWTKFTRDRNEAWLRGMDRQIRVHNEATWVSLNRFYGAMATLFQGGSLGGVRMLLTRN